MHLIKVKTHILTLYLQEQIDPCQQHLEDSPASVSDILVCVSLRYFIDCNMSLGVTRDAL